MADVRQKPFGVSLEALRAPPSARRQMQVYVIVVVVLILILQRVGFQILGTGPKGTLFLDALMLLVSSLAIASCTVACFRSRGVSRIFWLLFASASILELVGNGAWDYYHYFNIVVPDSALFPSLFYRLEAAPMAIALFLSDDVRASKLETFLDSCMVVGLVGAAMYQVQMSELNSHDPKIWQLITTGTAINVIIALAAILRFHFSAPGCLRSLFIRAAIYRSIFLVISFVTSFVDAYLPNIAASVDLLWIVPFLSLAALAITWRPPLVEEKQQKPRIGRRTALLCFNLTLAIMVLGSAVLGLRLVDSARAIGLIALGVVLFSFAIRSAITQDAQEKYLAALQDSRAALEHQALYDELTGLPNRRLFGERLSQVLAIAEREEHMVALFYLDLDGFKPVNDRLGHGIGDLLLHQVAHRMLSRARKSDTIARVGGDEFTWLVAHLSNRDHATLLAEEMLRSLKEPFEIDGNTITISASIGIALFPEGATDPADLIQQADCAMYAVKHGGKNGVGYYTPG